MNVETNTQPPQTQLCKSCHKFYGTQSHNWLCSKCHSLLSNTQTMSIKSEQVKPQQNNKPDESQPIKATQQNKSKCYKCMKKIGLLGIQCKCGFVYCNTHRLPQEHQCSIDYQEEGKAKLRKEIVKVGHQKLGGI